MSSIDCQATADIVRQRNDARNEILGTGMWMDTHLELEIPEDRVEKGWKTVTTRYTPLGVVGAICPWNFPLVLSVGKIAPALLTGNTIIVKPSPFTPYTTLKLVELAQDILPPGILQTLGGDDRLGPMLTAHPDIAKISFTGSIATGKKIMAACAPTLKRVTLELGGNDAAIILPDVDIPKVAAQVTHGVFFNSGQVSTSLLPNVKAVLTYPGMRSYEACIHPQRHISRDVTRDDQMRQEATRRCSRGRCCSWTHTERHAI